MTQQRRFLPFVMAGVPLMPFTGHAIAQISPFGWNPDTAQLTDEDWRLLWESTVSLNRSPEAVAGETRAWADSTSGNSGQVSLTRVFASNGLTCHELRYAISFAQRSGPQDYNFNWCRTSGGQWKIAP